MGISGLSSAELVVVGVFGLLLLLGVVLLFRWPSHGGSLSLSGPAAQAAEWDRRLASVPQHTDLRLISERLHTVERVCDVVRAELGGVKDAVSRVEKMTNLLLEQQLDVK